jgi:hypothetical protein
MGISAESPKRERGGVGKRRMNRREVLFGGWTSEVASFFVDDYPFVLIG